MRRLRSAALAAAVVAAVAGLGTAGITAASASVAHPATVQAHAAVRPHNQPDGDGENVYTANTAYPEGCWRVSEQSRNVIVGDNGDSCTSLYSITLSNGVWEIVDNEIDQGDGYGCVYYNVTFSDYDIAPCNASAKSDQWSQAAKNDFSVMWNLYGGSGMTVCPWWTGDASSDPLATGSCNGSSNNDRWEWD